MDIHKLEKVPTAFKILKSKSHEVDVGKLVLFPVDLSKLNGAVKNDVVKKDVYNKIKDIKD